MDKPNILLILSDQHRADCAGAENHPNVLTPNLDYLAAEGARFTRCYSTCPVCIPARRSILSGKFPHTHGARSYVECEWSEEETLPAILRKNGYHTYLAGRDMHQRPARKRFGFDHMVTQHDYFNWLDKITADNVYPRGVTDYGGGCYTSGVMHNDFTARPWHLEEYQHMTNWTVARAIEFLQNRDPSCPFFLTLSFLSPHPPLTPPRFYMERYLRQNLPPPAIGSWELPPEFGGAGCSPDSRDVNLSGELLRSCLAGYYGLINHMDDQLRRILNPTDGLYRDEFENTVIVYTSDHGEMLGDHYLFRKSQPYEGAARVPLYVKLPKSMRAGRRRTVDAAVSLECIMPTLLDAAGVEPPQSAQGKSLLPLILGEGKEIERGFVRIEYEGSFQALTDGRMKYIFWVRGETEQLFDLASDPNERSDLAPCGGRDSELGFLRRRLLSELSNHPNVYGNEIELLSKRINK